MRISVDRAKCTGIGVCESYAPEIFEVNEDGELVLATETVSADMLEAVQQAIAGCPTEALRLEQ